MDESKIYVGELNELEEVCAGEHFADKIELVEITLREEVVYDAELTIADKVVLAKALDEFGIPILQVHAQGAKEVIGACRDAGVKARFEVLCRPFNPYGFDTWEGEIESAIKAGADIVHPSITTPRKWAMGEPGMSKARIKERVLAAVKFSFDTGVSAVTVGFTDVPRTDLAYMIDTGGAAVSEGASMLTINDTVGVAKPALTRYLVEQLKSGTGGRVRFHCHDDFGLATANTLAALEAGADGAELLVNGADPARSGIAPLAEVVMALLCLYKRDLGFKTELLTELSHLFASHTGMPIEEQMPVVADRNWMYKRDHIMRTIIQDESIQFPFSPGMVGQRFQIGLGRGTGMVGVKAKLDELGILVSEAKMTDIVSRVNTEAVGLKRRLNDDEFKTLVVEIGG